MDKAYLPQRIETRWYEHWEKSGYFAPRAGGTPYCIVLPPPNVTGSLHMGHGFQHTLMDVLVRWRRMCGDEVLWQCGTDHAGIATQMLVERKLEGEGTSRHALGREAFLEKVWEWKKHSGDTITRQMRRIGASPDWSRERFTMDEGFSRVVRDAFVSWHRDGLIYRGKRLVNWDPVLKTALSDLEVEMREQSGHLWHLRYPVVGERTHLVVATTRPETMLGDAAVAVHPEDSRYAHLVGKHLSLPLCEREIPIVADSYVDPEFGSGCVKITPAHDFNDYQVGMRHDLPLHNVFTDDAKLNDSVPAAYRGLDRFEARKRIVRALEELDLVDKIEPYRHAVPHGDRSGTVLEPWLTDQWYLAMDKLKTPAIEAVKNGDTRFIPDGWKNTYFAWLSDVQDWCISRQLWWGHRIPAWYDETGKIYVGADEASVRAEHGLSPSVRLVRDPDVLDTWFSSALWTFGTLGWKEDESCFKRFHPTDVLVTGFDIIFFWVARMMMSTLYFTGQVPFRHVYITGLVLDAHGRKMSKSKGNILDPIDVVDGVDLEELVEKRTTGLLQPAQRERIATTTRKEFPQGIQAHGADALRFTFCALASSARDIRFDMGRVAGYRNFCNKLWNAARYVIQQAGESPSSADASPGVYESWIVSALQSCKLEVERALSEYRFDLAARCIHQFVWHSYCDWYLEISKSLLLRSVPEANATRHTLLMVLEELLRVVHPFMPFITEEVWQRLRPLMKLPGESVAISAYPQAEPDKIDQSAQAELDWLIAVVSAVRAVRGEFNLPYARKLNVRLRCSKAARQGELDAMLQGHRAVMTDLAGLESIDWLDGTAEPSAVQVVDDMEVLVSIVGLVDPARETRRLDKAIKNLESELGALKSKLERSSFVERAPSEVVAEVKSRYRQNQQTHAKLVAQRELVNSL